MLLEKIVTLKSIGGSLMLIRSSKIAAIDHHMDRAIGR